VTAGTYLVDVGAVILLVPLERGPQLGLAPRADDPYHLDGLS
jgi:hypothetical protein